MTADTTTVILGDETTVTATGSIGPTGATGPAGADGADGVGVPVGGTTGQVLAKASAANYDTAWSAPSGGVTDHGALTGLADDDHTQYQMKAAARVAFYWYRAASLRGAHWYFTQADSTSGRAWLSYHPYLPLSIEGLGVVVATGQADATFRLAVYEAVSGAVASLDAAFGSLLWESASPVDASEAGAKSTTGLAIPIPPAGVWLGWVGQFPGTAPTIRVVDYTYVGHGPAPMFCGGPDGIGKIFGDDFRGGAITITGVTGAWPASVAGAANGAAGIGWHIPDIAVRYSS